jgi:hypothetical protein
MSAIFSRLTLGLMGLDLRGLEIFMEGNNAANAEEFKKIYYPTQKKGNLHPPGRQGGRHTWFRDLDLFPLSFLVRLFLKQHVSDMLWRLEAERSP